MKTRTLLTLGLTVLLAATPMAQAQSVWAPTAFSFHGRLYESNAPANGSYDFEFRLFEAETNGMQAGPLVSLPTVPLQNGYFSANLDFGGGIFTGAPRFLEIQQRMSGNGAFVALSSRVPLFSTPQAIFAYSAATAAVATSVSPSAITAAALAPGAVNSVAIADGSVCSEDLCTNLLDHTFWRLLGNSGTDPAVNFLGTMDNKALTIRVNNTPALRLLPDPSAPGPDATAHSIVGGYLGNFVHPNVRAATIAGGGALIDPVFGGAVPGRNMIDNLGDFSFLGGGAANYISGTRNAIVGGHYNRMTNGNSSVIGGGEENLITFLPGNLGNTSLDWSVIGGGSENTLIFAADGAFIGAGHNNTATNFSAFIGAGGFNLAGGAYSVIAGGRTNRALGESSVIAGGTSNTVSGLGAAIGGGQRNSASGANGTVAGGFANTNSASYASIGGGFVNRAAGQDSVVAGGRSNLVLATAGAIAGGSLNSVFAPNSMVGGGTGNQVDAPASVIAGGQRNYIGGVTNSFAAILGGNANTNVASLATVLNGNGVLADKFGQVAFGTRFATNGDAQASFYHLRGLTTTNSLVGDLYLDGTGARLKLTRHSGWAFRALVIGKAIDNLSAAAFEVRGMVVNMDGTTTVLATTTPLGSYTGIPGFDAVAVADDVNDALVIRVTSGVGAAVRWSAQVETAEVNAPSTLF